MTHEVRRAAAGERRALDPQARLQHARDLAWRSLNRRDRTEVEIRRMLADKRVEPDAIDAVVAELIEGGYVDDARYAQRFAEDRRRLDSWGSERIERRLVALGVPRDHIAAAIGQQDGETELEAAVEVLRRRVPKVPETRLERDRALGLLMRRGYDAETALDALRRFSGGSVEYDPD
jgi:regulatory protein